MGLLKSLAKGALKTTGKVVGGTAKVIGNGAKSVVSNTVTKSIGKATIKAVAPTKMPLPSTSKMVGSGVKKLASSRTVRKVAVGAAAVGTIGYVASKKNTTVKVKETRNERYDNNDYDNWAMINQEMDNDDSIVDFINGLSYEEACVFYEYFHAQSNEREIVNEEYANEIWEYLYDYIDSQGDYFNGEDFDVSDYIDSMKMEDIRKMDLIIDLVMAPLGQNNQIENNSNNNNLTDNVMQDNHIEYIELPNEDDSNNELWICECGNINESNYCENCGKSFELAIQYVNKNDVWICKRCGNRNVSNFCVNCGERRSS